MEKCTKYMQKMVADLVGDVFHSLLHDSVVGGGVAIRTPASESTLGHWLGLLSQGLWTQ